MKKKKLWKAISAALSAVLLATSVPSAAFAAVPAKAADVQTKAADENELKLWYDEKAPDSYDGWEKSAPSAWKQRHRCQRVRWHYPGAYPVK